MYHHGMSNGSTEGPMYNPMMISSENQLGEIPGSNVGYDMTTDLVTLGLSYTFGNR